MSEIISTANTSGALQVSLSIHVSPARSSAGSLRSSAKALASISDAVLFPSRCSIASALDSLVQDSINPCSVCTDCTCASGPEGCPGDEEACCGGKTASPPSGELPSLAKTGGSSSSSTSGDEITELPPCCRPAPSDEGKEEEEKAKKGCCGGCRGGATRGEAWDASEKTLRGGLDVRRGGLAVVACGPTRMLADVKNAVAGLPIAKIVRIGGVEVHCESFGI